MQVIYMVTTMVNCDLPCPTWEWRAARADVACRQAIWAVLCNGQ